MLYGNECWALMRQLKHKVRVADMGMSRWMSGHTLEDKIQNKYIQGKVGVALIEGKMIKNHSKWFGYVQKRPQEAPARRVEQIILNPVRRDWGRPKRTLMKVVDRDLLVNNIPKILINDKAK